MVSLPPNSNLNAFGWLNFSTVQGQLRAFQLLKGTQSQHIANESYYTKKMENIFKLNKFQYLHQIFPVFTNCFKIILT